MNARAGIAAAGPAPIATDDRLAVLARSTAAPGFPESGASFELVPTTSLRIDPAYQRLVSNEGRAKIRRMIEGFSWARFGALILARHPGAPSLSVIDGQHRAIAAHHMGFAEVPAIVVTAAAEDQARDFLGINVTRTNIPSVDRFRAAVAAGDEQAVELHGILADLGVSYDVLPGARLRPRQTRAVSRLQKLVGQHGRGVVFTALELMIDAQPEEEELLTAFAVSAVVQVATRVIDAEGSIDRLADVIEATDFEEVRANASSMHKLVGGGMARHGTALLARAYNKGLHGAARIEE